MSRKKSRGLARLLNKGQDHKADRRKISEELDNAKRTHPSNRGKQT